MKRVKKRIFAGTVCEQLVYAVSDRADVKKAKPRERFPDEESRAAHRDAIARKRFARLINANHNPSSLYSTLTFDDANELHYFSDAKRIRTMWRKVLQRECPDAKIIIVIGRGDNTNRIHFHMISGGIPAEAIRRLWKYGKVVDAKPLRRHNKYNGVDCGTDYTGLANYLFDHWTEEQGGHRYMATRNHVKPEAETPVEVKREYTEERAPAAPRGYKLVEAKATPFGYIYYKYIKDPDVDFDSANE